MHSVNITGLGSDAFQQSILNVFLWDVRMSRQFEAQAWNAWSAVQGKEHTTMQLSNRILTPAFLCEDAEALACPYDKGRAVRSLVKDGSHKYIQDNEIAMYEHVVSGKMKK